MICDGCNKVYDDGYHFCPHCGHAKSDDKKLVIEIREPDTPQTCPACHRVDRSIIARSYVALQYEKLNANTTSKSNPLFDLGEIVGKKPKGFINSIFDSKFQFKLKAWEKAILRFMNEVYYCERCDELFFTNQGEKKHGLPEITLFLYGSYRNPITNVIHLPHKFEVEIKQLVIANKAKIAYERIQQIIGDTNSVPSHIIWAYIDDYK